jgi:cyclic-di-GMP-binding protein
MPSFDVVSEVKLEEVANAVDQTARELANRYDFKGTSAHVERVEAVVTIWGDSEFQLKQVADILYQKLTKRGIDIRAVDAGKVEAIAGDKRKQALTMKQGIGQELARRLVKLIKESGIKVQAAIQGDQLRVTGKKRDDLQSVIAMLRGQTLEQPLQYTNFRE